MPDVGEYTPSAEEQLEYEARLLIARDKEDRVAPTVRGEKIVWEAQEGSQYRFVASEVFEVLYHGTRGPGKTDGLLWAFASRVGLGHGAAWTGIIFRQTYPQLADIQAKSEKWFRQIFPAAKFNRSKMMWEWPTGERLLFRHMNRPQDYWNYHGHEYPFIGWEELCNWANSECYTAMFACCRCSTVGVPRMVRATTNPYGSGHHWVKDRFALHGRWWDNIVQENPLNSSGQVEQPRVAIYGHIDENKILLKADPEYKKTIIASASNPAMAEAWLAGSWDIVAGGMFGDVWKAKFNIVRRFIVPLGWRLDRSFDWGSSKPFSVGWWAQSDGSDLRFDSGDIVSTVRGDLFRIKEWYGWTGQPNQGLHMLATEVAKGVVEREMMWGWRRDSQSSLVRPGPADSSIYTVENGVSIANDMARPVRIGDQIHKGVSWTQADKRPGSRKTGWEMIRKMMKAAWPIPGRPRETAGLFVVGEECPQFLRTVIALARLEKDMDDIDTDAEDHIADEARYRIRAVGNVAKSGTHIGMY